MQKDRQMSQETFDDMLGLASGIRDRAIARRYFQTARGADRMDALLHNFVTELIIEGRVPEAS
jgi:hypothetical protein